MKPSVPTVMRFFSTMIITFLSASVCLAVLDGPSPDFLSAALLITWAILMISLIWNLPKKYYLWRRDRKSKKSWKGMIQMNEVVTLVHSMGTDSWSEELYWGHIASKIGDRQRIKELESSLLKLGFGSFTHQNKSYHVHLRKGMLIDSDMRDTRTSRQ